jgi:putative oxidoreductase
MARRAPWVRATAALERVEWLIPTLARLVFANVLLVYFMTAGLTKPGDGLAGLWTPSAGAYAQVFPRVFEAAGYDTAALGLYHRAVVVLATWVEMLLPFLIVLGLATRLAAAGMVVFVLIQSLTDVLAHGQQEALGAWFDRFPDAAILDQRALWCFVLVVLVFRGAGPVSLDRALFPGR